MFSFDESEANRRERAGRAGRSGGVGFRCPFCTTTKTRVIDSRTLENGNIRRRRSCQQCGQRFTTYEGVSSDPQGNIDEVAVRREARRILLRMVSQLQDPKDAAT